MNGKLSLRSTEGRDKAVAVICRAVIGGGCRRGDQEKAIQKRANALGIQTAILEKWEGHPRMMMPVYHLSIQEAGATES